MLSRSDNVQVFLSSEDSHLVAAPLSAESLPSSVVPTKDV